MMKPIIDTAPWAPFAPPWMVGAYDHHRDLMQTMIRETARYMTRQSDLSFEICRRALDATNASQWVDAEMNYVSGSLRLAHDTADRFARLAALNDEERLDALPIE